MPSLRTRALLLALLPLGVGCYEGVGDPDGADGASGDSTGDGSAEGDAEGAMVDCEVHDPGPAPLRRLSAFEYDNTIEDLLDDDRRLAQAFPAEGAGGFDNNADAGSAGRLVVEAYMFAAEAIAARAVERLDELLPCDEEAIDEACVGAFIDQFVPRAWRRPLTASERTGLRSYYADASASYGASAAVGLLLQRVLESPHFLYRVELGDPRGGEPVMPLRDHELATRLSYLMWGSMPDEIALAKADAGELHTLQQVEQEARRMVADPRSERMVLHFHEQWLGYARLEDLSRDAERFPEYGPAIVASQRAELEGFIRHVIFEGEGTLHELLAAPYTLVDAPLADYYGLDREPGPGLRPARADDRDTSGLLTQGAILAVAAKATETHPIARGVLVREQLLCQIPPPPPTDLPLEPPAPDPDATTRERYEQHRIDPSCSGCHALFDPIGFGLENFDATGRWRSTENGLAIDASGELSQTDVDGPFVGAAELGARLARSEQVHDCVATQWFRYGHGRTETPERDACSLGLVKEGFADADGDIRELLVALTQTDAFMVRPTHDAGS